MEISQLIGHRFRVGVILNNLGIIAYETGQYSDAIRFQQESLAVESEIDDQAGLAFAHINLGDIWRELGVYDRARQDYTLALDQAKAINDRMTESLVFSAFTILSTQTGELDDALVSSEKALALARETESPIYIVHALARAAAALAANERLDEAEDAYHEALVLLKSLNQYGRVMECLAGLARIALKRGQLDLALSRVNEICTNLRILDLDGTDEPAKLYLTCYTVLKRAGQDDAARQSLAAGVKLLQKRAAAIEVQTLRSSYLERVAEHRELLGVWELEQRI